MKADWHRVARCTARSLVWLLCGAALSACDFRPSAPESRATYFVEKFITAPQAMDDLRAVARLAEDQNPETLASDLPTRSAVAYLRARQRLGADLGFHAAGTSRNASGNRVVKVIVSESTATKDTAVRFEVELHNQDQVWLVVRLQSD